MILEKVRSYLWKSELGFWTFRLICVLSSSNPKLAFNPETLTLKYFFRLDYFIGFNLWFWTKWDKSSGLMAWWFFFWGSNCQKLVLSPTLERLQLLDQNLFYAKLHKILHKTSPYFQILSDCSQIYECLFQENCKKNPSKIPF